MTSTSHDLERLLHRDALTHQLMRDARQLTTQGERSLIRDASKQRDVWRHDVKACQRHVSQLTAHVSQLTSADDWQRLDTSQLPGNYLSSGFSVTVACCILLSYIIDLFELQSIPVFIYLIYINMSRQMRVMILLQ